MYLNVGEKELMKLACKIEDEIGINCLMCKEGYLKIQNIENENVFLCYLDNDKNKIWKKDKKKFIIKYDGKEFDVPFESAIYFEESDFLNKKNAIVFKNDKLKMKELENGEHKTSKLCEWLEEKRICKLKDFNEVFYLQIDMLENK